MYGSYSPPTASAQQNFALPESDDRYTHVVVQLNTGWRIIECRDGVQWILQHRNRAETVARNHRDRNVLIERFGRFCGEIDPAAAAALAALPPRIGGIAGTPDITVTGPPVVTAPPVVKVPAKVLDAVARSNSRPAGLTGMQAAFLTGAKRRIARDPRGKIVLPTGAVEAGELAQVLQAIERAR